MQPIYGSHRGTLNFAKMKSTDRLISVLDLHNSAFQTGLLLWQFHAPAPKASQLNK